MSTNDSTRPSKILKRHSLKIGDKFDRLIVAGSPEDRRNSRGDRVAWYSCRCQCGTECEVEYGALVSGNTKSCGCRQRDAVGSLNRTHGQTESRLYSIWSNMVSRCENPNATEFHNYGARGICLCREWRQDFAAFARWANSNGYADPLSIERKDYNGNYEPSNCTWIPLSKQSDNSRRSVLLTAFSETKSAKRWSEDPRCLVPSGTLIHRIRHGWSHVDAIATPPSPNNFPGRNARRSSKATA